MRPLGSASNHTSAEAPNQMAQPAREERASEDAPHPARFALRSRSLGIFAVGSLVSQTGE